MFSKILDMFRTKKIVSTTVSANYSTDEIKSELIKILDLDKSKDSWDIINHSPEVYIYDDDSLDYIWNRFAKRYGFTEITEMRQDNDSVVNYKSSSIKIQYNGNREDNLLGLISLASLIKDDFKLFYCCDSYHSSDIAFLAIPNDLWESIYKNYPESAIQYRLIDANIDSFFEVAFSEQNQRTYEENITSC